MNRAIFAFCMATLAVGCGAGASTPDDKDGKSESQPLIVPDGGTCPANMIPCGRTCPSQLAFCVEGRRCPPQPLCPVRIEGSTHVDIGDPDIE